MFTRPSRPWLRVFAFTILAASGHAGSSEDTEYQSFSDVASIPGLGHSDMTATLFDGSLFSSGHARIYLVGGCVADQVCPTGQYCTCPTITADCNYFQPGTNTWHNCTVAPRARYRHVAANSNNKLYLFGGRNGTDSVVTEVDVLDPVAGTWESTPFTWNAASSDLSAFTEGNDVYLAGGWDPAYTPLATLTKYTPATQTLTALTAMPGGGRGDTAAASIVRSAGASVSHFVLGGFGSSNCEPLKTVEEYNVAAGTWTTRPDLLLGRGDLAVGTIGTHLFAIAGETKDSTCMADFSSPGVSIPVDDVERLSKHTTWVVEQSIPANRFRFVSASFGRTIYLFGGQGTLNTSTVPQPTHHVLTTTTRYIPETIHKEDLSDEEIAGIVIAGIVVIGVLVVGLIFGFSCWKYRRYKALQTEAATTEAEPPESNPVGANPSGAQAPSVAVKADETPVKADETPVGVALEQV